MSGKGNGGIGAAEKKTCNLASTKRRRGGDHSKRGAEKRTN